MNEMYDMSIVTHNFSVLIILVVININLYKIFTATEVQAYRKFHMLFNPMGTMVIGAILFTGVIMMAAKHLDFTFANIIMIVFSIFLIVLEVKRSRGLRHIMNADLEGFLKYKKFAVKILIIEFVASLVLYIGMLV